MTNIRHLGPVPRAETLTGWGRTNPALCSVAAPRSIPEV